MPFDLTAVNAATLEKINKKFTDNLSTKTPLLFKMRDEGGRWLFGGGALLKFPVITGSGNAGSYQGDDVFNTNRPEGLISLEYSVKQFYSTVTIVGLEEILNSGEGLGASVLDGRMEQAEITTAEDFETMLFGLGTGNSSKDWLGLRAIVTDTPLTGTIGGQSRASNAQLRNQTYTTPITAFNTANAGRTGMITLWADCVRGLRKPNFITTTVRIWTLFNISMTQNERFIMTDSQKKMQNAGFETLAFHTAPVTMSSACPTDHMYFLRIAPPMSSGGTFLAIHRDRNFKMQPFLRPYNQDVRIAQILSAGELCTDAPYLNGVVTNITG